MPSPRTAPSRLDAPRSRKEESHFRIVRAASRLFRRDGQSATGIDGVMAEAGLTHGGFYAHFRDKAALFSEAIGDAFDQAEANLLARGLEDLRGAKYVEAATQRYLSMAHRKGSDEGCVVAALGAEVPRAPATVRRSFTKRLDGIVDRIAARLEGRDARTRATQLLSFWVGTLLVSRNLPEAEAAELLKKGREAALRLTR